MLNQLYRPTLNLLTDLYELTMANAYWKAGVQERYGVFHLFFRSNPFRGGFTLTAGLSMAIDYLENLHFDKADIEYLASLEGNDGQKLFEKGFLDYLSNLKFRCDVDGIPEGTVVFPHEPLLRVCGPLIEGQIIESMLLNAINFQTLIATKAARVTMAAQGEPVLEFGLRRAQGIDGALSASRAAYLGGCAATSNVLAGRLFGIPVRGTHAHSWVMCFGDELEAFRMYAQAMPNNCVFLVDTYDTLEGVRRATQVGRMLREQGHEMVGIRLDSGDLAYLSIEARRILDEAGFPKAAIVASNDLDEHLITSLKNQGAKISVWGVGTRLITAHDQPALGGVYKLSAVRDDQGPWRNCVKVSEQTAKVSSPGILQVRRCRDDGHALGDIIYDTQYELPENVCTIVDPADATRRKKITILDQGEDLLVPLFREGRRVYQTPTLENSRRRAAEQLNMFHSGIKRFENPHDYPAGLEEGLHQRKTELILSARKVGAGDT
ncbi:MAG: nicotinate phosphoribosyltransferase [Pirellulales bacterium]|nr:nicotinate phosphoribosyltransferase [Pirellulales bacterium]